MAHSQHVHYSGLPDMYTLMQASGVHIRQTMLQLPASYTCTFKFWSTIG